MPRNAAEISAEAQRLDQEAQDIATRAQTRLNVAQRTVTNAAASAQTARASAADALTAAAAGNLIAAEAACGAATAHLTSAATLAAQAFAGLAGSDPKDEWKECRQSIDRFDKLLVDLRKTGFGFITTVVGASALFIGTAASKPSAELQFGVFVIIAIMIILLFAVDCTHQVWLKTAVGRATYLETKLSYELTTKIASKFSGREAWFIGIALYIVFFAITSVIFWVALDVSAQPNLAVYQGRVLIGAIVGALLLLLIGVVTYRR
jgi:hypothetical protein